MDPWFEGTLSPGVALEEELTRNGLNAASGNQDFRSTGWNTTDVIDLDNHYLSFSFRPSAGYTVELDSFKFTQSGSPAVPNTIRIAHGVNASPPGMTFVEIPTSLASMDHEVSLGGATIEEGDLFEVRIYVYGSLRPAGTASSSAGAFRLEAMEVTGTAIPEPGTYAILLGTVMLFGAVFGKRAMGGRKMNRVKRGPGEG